MLIEAVMVALVNHTCVHIHLKKSNSSHSSSYAGWLELCAVILSLPIKFGGRLLLEGAPICMTIVQCPSLCVCVCVCVCTYMCG